ncbi:MAG: discoidin domain-containing protein [Candidatus Kapabacteria bacterium]|nr:discoidin domain-containing protein [Candidatus Kapabacteria bacterium]
MDGRIMVNFASILCLLTFCLSACIPHPPTYPWRAIDSVMAEGQHISDGLDRHIMAFLNGTGPGEIPDSLLPDGITDGKDFRVVGNGTLSPDDLWEVRSAKPIDHQRIYNSIPDPHVTYLFLRTPIAPFGHKLVVEGDFPHCRFFSMQMSPPLDGKNYYAQRVYGSAEVSIVDIDIKPDSGSINPFLVGANRDAENRRYRMVFEMTAGDPVRENGTAFIPPYRGSGNTRRASLITYGGSWGVVDFKGDTIPGGGEWNYGALWVRIYLPDETVDSLGGVALPTVYWEAPDGRRYQIESDASTFRTRVNTTHPARTTLNTQPDVFSMGLGWAKSWGILRSMLVGACMVNNWLHPDSLAKVRAVDKGVSGRGHDMPPPGNYEPHATTNNYATYLGRSVYLKPGHVAVLTGILPTIPQTRDGASIMRSAQVRYWSICGYDYEPLAPTVSGCVNALVDEDVVVDSLRRYMIVYARNGDMPSNARRNVGVTPVEWGPTGDLGLLLRWVSVSDDWSSSPNPHERQLPWERTDRSVPGYDSALIGENWHGGHLGAMLPRLHIMTTEEFEALGGEIRPDNIPITVDRIRRPHVSMSFGKPVNVSSVLNETTRGDFAVDKDVSTAWSSGFGQDSSVLVIDLQRQTIVSTIRLVWGFAWPQRISVETSRDGTTFAQLSENVRVTQGIDVFPVSMDTVRFVRIVIHSTALGWADIAECEVHSPEFVGDVRPTSARETEIPRVTVQQIGNEVRVDRLVYDRTMVARFYDLRGRLVKVVDLPCVARCAVSMHDLAKGVYSVSIPELSTTTFVVVQE